MIKSRVLYFLFLLAVILFYLFYPFYISFVMLVFTLVFPILLFLIVMISRFTMKYQLNAEGKDILLTIENPTYLHVAAVRLTFLLENSFTGEKQEDTILMPIGSKNVISLKLTAFSKYCGHITVKLRKVKYYDFLFLTSLSQKPMMQKSVLIWPEILSLTSESTELLQQNLLLQSEDSSGEMECQSSEKSSDIFGYHAYSAGEPLQNVHWKLTSKLDQVMVKEYAVQLSGNAALFLGLEKNADIQATNYALSGAVSLSFALLELGIAHTFNWYSKEEERVISMPVSARKELEDALISYYEYGLQSPFSAQILTPASVLHTNMLYYFMNTFRAEQKEELYSLSKSYHLILSAAKTVSIPQEIMEQLRDFGGSVLSFVQEKD